MLQGHGREGRSSGRMSDDKKPNPSPEPSTTQDLQRLLDNAPEVITRYNRALQYVYINPAVERFTGHTPDYYLGKSDVELDTPAARTTLLRDDVNTVFETGHECVVEVEVNGPHGRTWHKARLVPERGPDGEIETVLALFQDISQLKNAEAALRESESRFRTLVETAPEAIVVVDADSGQFVDGNRFASELYGLELDELLTVGPAELSPLRQPDGRRSDQAAQAYLQAALHGHTPVFEWLHVHADGHEIPCEVRLVRLPSANGSLVRATIYDIQSRKDAELARQEQEARYRELFDRVPVGLYRTAPSGEIIDVNDALVQLLGYPDKEALLRRTAMDMQTHEVNREHWKRRLEEHGVYYGYETQLLRADGSRIWVRENTRVVYGRDGGIRYYEGSMEDITGARCAHVLLKESELRYRSLFEGVPVGIYRSSPSGEILQANQKLVSMLGYPDRETLLASNATGLYPDPADRDESVAILTQEGTIRDNEFQIRRLDGQLIWVRENAHTILDENGDVRYFEGTMEDISIQKAAQEEVDRLAAFPTENPNPVLASNMHGELTYVNPSARLLVRRLGLTRIEELLPEDHNKLIQMACASDRAVHSGNISASGRTFRWSYYPQVKFNTVHLYALDITDQKNAEDRLRYEAFHDSLTGLANRALFMDHLKQAVLKLQRRVEYRFGVLFLDLDRFKVINDSLGHMVGDQLLVQVGKRIRACVRQVDTVARLGGDEFAILIEDIESIDDGVLVARRVQTALKDAFHLDDQPVFTGTSIGIAISHPGYVDGEEIVRDADIAMYRAKSNGTPYEVFQAEMREATVQQMTLETELRQALVRDEFVLHYQPVFEFPGRSLVGLEALLRWQHPRRGLLMPSTFMDAAETAGIMPSIGAWTLREACRQMGNWHEQVRDLGRLFVSVNLSDSQIRDPSLLEKVESCLDSCPLPAESLTLEIPEGILLRDAEAIGPVLQKLKRLGISLYIDDFGTGYSSLNLLHEFRIDAVKIDQSIVQGLTPDQESEAMVGAILDMARNLTIDVIAEGVETETQHACLAQLKSRRAQGYLYSSPLNSASTLSLLKDEKANRSPL
jgi:diguanylate cyclase (GGDEF)-like protein/PAS domain S-box-containing protein